MAKIIDSRDNELDETTESDLTFEDSQEQPSEEEVVEQSQEDELPEKYRGKTVAEIAAMHQHAEQLIGKQGQEVGELRKLIDSYIYSQSVAEKEQAHNAYDDFDDSEFFENPKESIKKLLDNHPSVKQSQQLAAQLKQQETLAKLKLHHPDFVDIVQNPKFLEWVEKSKVRTRLLVEADKQYDYDSADELLTLWKERQETVKTAVETETKQRKQQVKAASAGSSSGSGERPTRKVYRRADIIELMAKDPERYRALMPEIRQAYAEKRVK